MYDNGSHVRGSLGPFGRLRQYKRRSAVWSSARTEHIDWQGADTNSLPAWVTAYLSGPKVSMKLRSCNHPVRKTKRKQRVVTLIRYRGKTRSPAVGLVADRTGCWWPSSPRSMISISLSCDVRLQNYGAINLTWKSVCHFLLVINSILGLISHRLRGVVSFLLKTHFLSPLFNRNFENVHFALGRWDFARQGLRRV